MALTVRAQVTIFGCTLSPATFTLDEFIAIRASGITIVALDD
jgi:hypothetical protein